jgi:hypothetical protein
VSAFRTPDGGSNPSQPPSERTYQGARARRYLAGALHPAHLSEDHPDQLPILLRNRSVKLLCQSMMDSQQVSLVIVGEVDRAAISADADEILQGQAIRGLHQPENSLYGHIRIPSSYLR